jgi:sec-independent protein translocase protein TatA
MGTFSAWHWLILLAVGMLAFGGKGKISSIMGDVADGIKSFKKGMADDTVEAKKLEEQKALEAQKAGQTSPTGSSTTKL